jgi:hypothetical protein
LVDAGRADLVIAVTERRISPFQAARIADRAPSRGVRRTVVSESDQKMEPAKPAARIDPRALIG